MMLFLLGMTGMVLVLRDVFHSVVPRGMSTTLCIGPFLARRLFWPPFLFIASKIASPVRKAEILSLFAPFFLLILLIIWICLLTASLALISFPLASKYSPTLDSPLAAFYVSGASVLTIGVSEFVAKTNDVRFLLLGSALTGMIMTASLVSFMFALIASIQDREVLVSLTSSVGGSPPSGIAILETYSQMHGRKFLPALFDEWHHWCANVLETHKAYPILPYFRSNDPFTSWLTALGAALDSTALILSMEPDINCFSARMTYLMGSKLVNEFVHIFHLNLAPQKEISDDEFHSLYLRLQAAGFSSKSEEVARLNFRMLRQEYLGAHRALCEHLAMPVTPLSTENVPKLPLIANA